MMRERALADEEEHTEHDRRDRQHDQVDEAPGPVEDQMQRYQRRGATGLDDNKQAEQGHRGGEQAGDDFDARAALADPDEAVDEQGQPGGGQHGPAQVQASLPAGRLGDEPRGQRDDGQPDGHVDEQHPPPRHLC
jgi:hypothetical protein